MATEVPTWKALLSRRMVICIFTGFASGLPLWLLLNLVPAWLRTEKVSLADIGLMALIQLPYTWKFVWAPILDRYVPPLGRRRGWMAFSQVGLIGAIGALGHFSPRTDLDVIVVLVTLVAVFSANQDIALDAYRRELLSDAELGLGNVVHVNAYKVAGLVPGSLSLILADHLPWTAVFWVTALFMLPGLAMTLVVKEPALTAAPRTLTKAVIEPFREFLTRNGLGAAALTLAFIFAYPLAVALCTALATPFYLDMGYSKSDVGLVAKHAMLWPSVVGGLVGGAMMVRLGINRALWLFAVVQMASVLGFAWLASQGHQLTIGFDQLARLAVVLSLEALAVGLGTSALVAFIARTTHPSYTATQLALFSSFAAVPRTVVSAGAGAMVESLGWVTFFLVAAVLAVPGIALLARVAPWGRDPKPLTVA